MAVSGRGLLCAPQAAAAAAARFPSKRSRPVAAFKRVAGSEVMLIRRWLAKGETAAAMASLLGRHRSTAGRRAARMAKPGPMVTKSAGRPPKLDAKTADRLVSKTAAVVAVADKKYQMTAATLRQALRLKRTARTILVALRGRGSGDRQGA